MIETRRLKNVVIFIQTILNFVLSRKITIFNSSYLNNKVTCEKFDVLLYATFGRPLDVQISLLSTRLQWTEKGRPMDVQYGTWTDGPNKDVLSTSLGRAIPIGKYRHFQRLTFLKQVRQDKEDICSLQRTV